MTINIDKVINHPGSTFNLDLQVKYNVILRGVLARNDDGSLALWVNPPKSAKIYKSEIGQWLVKSNEGYLAPSILDKELFPDVHLGADYPTEVKVKIM